MELKKVWPGTKGDVTLNIGTSAGGHQTDQQILSGTNGTTGANTVDTGTFFVSESSEKHTAELQSRPHVDNPLPLEQIALSTGSNDSVAVGTVFFFFNDTATTEIYTLSLHDALPICTKGDVTLNIGTSAGGHQTDQQILSGTNGTTGANTVDTGTFFVSE